MQDPVVLGIDLAAKDAAPMVGLSEQLSRHRRKTIVMLTAGMSPNARALIVDAAFALRRAARGPSKLARRLRRKSQLGLAGAY